jgi:serine/threonine-protein kinase
MAPEQWECAKRVTGAADVYSLGIVLYLLASGHPPFSDARRQVLMYEHLVASPPPLPTYVPRAASQVIRAMLAKRSADRPSAQECAERLSAKY